MSHERRQLNQQSQSAWDAKAQFWDELQGDEGNSYQRYLVNPASERLLAVQPGMRVLDAACGNGVFSRRLASLGANVTAFDFSAAQIERAQARSTTNITYHQVDGTDEQAILALGQASQFDAAVCNMALMDMAEITPLFQGIYGVLKSGAPFVWSVLHPCFEQHGSRKIGEREALGNRIVDRRGIAVFSYLNTPPHQGVVAQHDPSPHNYFDRPLNELFGVGFAAGFVMDGIEEPAFNGEHNAPNPLSWAHYPHIPPILVVRMRKF